MEDLWHDQTTLDMQRVIVALLDPVTVHCLARTSKKAYATWPHLSAYVLSPGATTYVPLKKVLGPTRHTAHVFLL